MLETGIILSVLIFGGMFFLWLKLPKWVKNRIVKADFFIDFIASGCVFLLLGCTVVALIAGATVGLMVSLGLYMRRFWIKGKEKYARRTYDS